MIGYDVQKDAILDDEVFDPRTNSVARVDSGLKRWIRGYKKKLLVNSFNLVYFLGALATAGLGIYASVTAMNETYSTTAITAFSCKNPAS